MLGSDIAVRRPVPQIEACIGPAGSDFGRRIDEAWCRGIGTPAPAWRGCQKCADVDHSAGNVEAVDGCTATRRYPARVVPFTPLWKVTWGGSAPGANPYDDTA